MLISIVAIVIVAVLRGACKVQVIHHLFMRRTTAGGNDSLCVLLENMLVGAKAWLWRSQTNEADYHPFSVCTRAGFALPVSAYTQRSRPKTQPILKLTDCEDVKRNIISVLIINQGTIKGFASFIFLFSSVFICILKHPAVLNMDTMM